jgi:hypothetical protein
MTSPNSSSAHGDLVEGISRIAEDRLVADVPRRPVGIGDD